MLFESVIYLQEIASRSSRIQSRTRASSFSRRPSAFPWLLLAGVILLRPGGASAAVASGYQRSTLVPPEAAREFRGMWIATVANIDWPSRPGLSAEEQKRQLLQILDRAVELRFNAVVLQVRPACDALYASTIEPWSEYLSGVMGKAPTPYYDPLAFAVQEAHKRGLELHAWFNPYRALHFSGKSPIAANHISRTHPEFVKHYGKYLWLDPGEPGVRDYSLSVVMDVVRRYDIDAVHFDDYFYPDKADAGTDAEFPDETSWRRYVAGGRQGEMSREDWRRQNVNTFLERTYRSIKAAKPWVKFGVSPRGIWRPGYPPQIKGMDAYATLFADSRKWLLTGWVDYLSPQLYWPMDSREQNFGKLLSWWARQNPKGRHLWPGLSVVRADLWKPEEIPGQIHLIRKEPGVTGYICYNASSLMGDSRTAAKLQTMVNREPALVPATPWLGTNKPAMPALFLSASQRGGLQLMLGKPSQRDQTSWWLVQTRSDGNWTTEILAGKESVKNFRNSRPEAIAVSRIDRIGLASEPVVFERRTAAPVAFTHMHEDHGAN